MFRTRCVIRVFGMCTSGYGLSLVYATVSQQWRAYGSDPTPSLSSSSSVSRDRVHFRATRGLLPCLYCCCFEQQMLLLRMVKRRSRCLRSWSVLALNQSKLRTGELTTLVHPLRSLDQKLLVRYFPKSMDQFHKPVLRKSALLPRKAAGLLR